MKTPHEILGVSKKASMEEICKAYNKLASEYDPEKLEGNPLAYLAEERFKEIKTAFEKLNSTSCSETQAKSCDTVNDHNTNETMPNTARGTTKQSTQEKQILTRKGIIVSAVSLAVVTMIILIFTVITPYIVDQKKVRDVEELISSMHPITLAGIKTVNKNDLEITEAAYYNLDSDLQEKVENRAILLSAIASSAEAEKKAADKKKAEVFQEIRSWYRNFSKVNIKEKKYGIEVYVYSEWTGNSWYVEQDGKRLSEKKWRKMTKHDAQYFANKLNTTVVITWCSANGRPRISASAIPKTL